MYDDWNGQLGLPDLVEIEPTETCNLRCKMCHVSYMPQISRPSLDHALIPKLSSLKGKYAIIGSAYEPTMNRGFASIIRSLTDIDCKLELISNGVLIKDEVKSALVDSDLYRMTFSFDGIRKETYEKIRRGAHYEEVIENIVEFRSAFKDRDTYFSINSTVLRSNLPEVKETVAFWDGQNFDALGFIYMVIRDLNADLIRECTYPIREEYCRIMDEMGEMLIRERRRIMVSSAHFVESPLRERYPKNFIGSQLVSDHPGVRLVPNYRHVYQLGDFPGMSFPCKSPFSFARILPNADVQLCYQFTIGNLNDNNFEDIWFGERAHQVRKQVMQDTKTCDSCDYYRFCLKGAYVGVNNPVNYLMQELVPHVNNIDFESGTVKGAVWKRRPQLIDSVEGFNIVEFGGEFLVVPQALGNVDLDRVDEQTRLSSNIRSASSRREAKRLAMALQNPLAGFIASDTLKKIM